MQGDRPSARSSWSVAEQEQPPDRRFSANVARWIPIYNRSEVDSRRACSGSSAARVRNEVAL